MIWWLLACTSSSGTPEDLEQTLSAQDSLADCARMPLEGARITCQVTQAARAGALGDVSGVEAACTGLEEIWLFECRFRAGEELGKAGFTDAALRQCAQAQDFARNCVTHAAWGLPKQPGLSPEGAVGPAMAEFEGVITTALSGAPQGVAPEAVDTLMARAWFNLYVGSGSADPTAAQSAENFQAHARSAWAIELARLADRSDVDGVATACWQDPNSCPSGKVLGDPKGRYSTPVVVPATEQHPHVAGFGGSIRLSPEDPELDLAVAVLEGQFFREASGPEAFAAYLTDPRDPVRWTACKLHVLAGGAPQGQPDSTCAAYEALALQTRRRMQKRDKRAVDGPR